MDRQIKKRMKHKATWYKWISSDGRGDKQFADPVELPCFRASKISVVRTLAGDERASALQLYFDGIVDLSGQDEILFAGTQYPVLAYSPFDGLKEGTGLTVVYL